MTRDLIYERSRGPIVTRETLKIVRLVSLDGIGDRTHALRFEREVLTIRETEASARMVGANGRVMNEGTRHNDFYGFLSSPRYVLPTAANMAAEAGLGLGDKVRFEVVLKVIDRRFLPSNRANERIGGTEYLVPPGDWLIDDEVTAAFIADQGKPYAERQFDVRPTQAGGQGEPHALIIWRSDFDEEANLEIANAGIAAAIRGITAFVLPDWLRLGEGFAALTDS